MENMNICENLQQANNVFKVWLKEFHKESSIKHNSLKSRLSLKQQEIKELKNSSETLLNSCIGTSCLAVDVLPNKFRTQLESDVNHLKIKSEQLNKHNEAINAKADEETKKMRKIFYELINKDEIALKPYHEVEEVIRELNLKADFCKRELNENKETFMKKLKEGECYFNQIQENILMMEPIEQEMRISVGNCNKIFTAKLRSLKLKSIDEANNESNEAQEILAYISNTKSQLNSQ